MKIYRKLIPSISKEIIRHLLAEKAIEIIDGHREDADLDIASVLVTYLNEEEKLNQDARDLIEHRGLSIAKFGVVKKNLADTRNLPVGDGTFDWLLQQLVQVLFNSNHVAEVFAADNELMLVMRETIKRYLGVDEQLDKEVRGRLRHIREGTPDWEVEYEKLIEQMRHTHGLR